MLEKNKIKDNYFQANLSATEVVVDPHIGLED